MSVIHKPKHVQCSTEEQLRRWVEGESVHRDFGPKGHPVLGPTETYECCPDFSCCRPHLLWPPERRKAFAAATEKERGPMLAASLAALVADVQGRKTEVTPGGAVLVSAPDPERKPS